MLQTALRSALIAVAVAAVGITHLPAVSAAPASRIDPMASTAPTDRFIVRYKQAAPDQAALAGRRALLESAGAAQRVGLSSERRLALGAELVRADRGLDAAAAQRLMSRLLADPRVASVERDLALHPAAIEPPDPDFTAQRWHLEAIHAPGAWAKATGRGVVVGVIDTGVVAHADLARNLVPGYDFVSDGFAANDGDGRDADATDPGDGVSAGACAGGNAAAAASWHGTRTAATVAAARNSLGGVGVAFEAKVMPIRALGRCGGRASDVADAIVWAAGGAVPGVPANRNPVEVINLSLSGVGTCGPTLQAAIDFANAAGTAVVVAAGNDSADVRNAAPASCTGTIVVGAVDAQGKLAPYSNVGADLVAPGGDAHHLVVSARLDGDAPRAGYMGTSAAAAHVAGVAALVQSVKARSPSELERLLRASAQWLDCDGACGAGLVDADKAVAAAMWPSLLMSGPTTVVEGTGGVKQLTYTVSLSEPYAEPITFRTTFDRLVGASPGKDYTYGDWGTQTFAPGETSREFVVGVVGDAQTELTEQYYFEAQSTSSNITYTYAGVVTRIDDDDIDVLANGETRILDGSPIQANDFRDYRIDVPAGSPRLNVRSTTTSPLYVRQGAQATTSDMLCPESSFTDERVCAIANPAAGPWYIAAAGSNGATLMATYEPIGVSVRDARLNERNDGTRTMTFVVDMPAPLVNTVSFDLATANGSAAAGSDYVAASATGLTIPAGMVSKTFSVGIVGDTADEADETFSVNLTNVVGAPVVRAQAIGTIVDDDGTAGLTIADASVDEGGALVFVASLPAPQATAVAFEVFASDGTATGGTPPIYENQVTGDYIQRPIATGFIPAGQLATTLVVQTQEDTEIEADETMLVEIVAVYGATAGDRLAVGTIRNDDERLVNIGSATVVEYTEGYRTATITASLSHVATHDVSFHVARVGGTAVAADVEPLPTTLFTIPAGQGQATFQVTAIDDTLVESREQLLVGAIDVVGAGAGAPGTITILSDEMPTISISDTTVTEGNAGTRLVSFTVQLSQPVDSPVRYAFYAPEDRSVPNAAEIGEDYDGVWDRIGTIPAGQSSQVQTVVIKGDTLPEGDETFGAYIDENWIEEAVEGRVNAVATIVDDDGAPTLSVDDMSIVEGDSGTKVLTFTARLGGPNNAMPATFAFSTRNGTATAGSDYNARVGGQGYFAPGELVRTFNIVVAGDTAVEPTESFVVDLSPMSGLNIVDRQATGYIINNDGPLLSINDVAVGEGNAGTKLMTFTVSLSQPAAGPVSYNFVTQGGDATVGVDYVSANLTNQVIPAGQLSKTHTVVINGDTTIEPTEVLLAYVRQPVGASVWDGQGTGYILNDDGPTLSIPDASVAEGQGGIKVMNVTVQLSQAATVPVTFSIATQDVTANASDYTGFNLANQTIPAGQTSKVFQVPVSGDVTVEQNETFLVTLAPNPVGASLYDRQAIATIYNDDGPTLSVNDVSISEGNAGTKVATFTVSLSQAAAVPVSYNIATSNLTATAGSDYVATALNNETIPAGQLTKTFSVTLNGDTTVESNETFRVTLSNISAGATLFKFTGTGTITNDD
jgi:hypothetical protein